MGKAPARRRRILALLGLATAVLGAAGSMIAPGRADSFTFQRYKGYDNETAIRMAGQELNGRFPAGSSLDEAVGTLKAAGAECRILEKYPDFVYCTHEHADAGLRALFVTVEWKLLVYFDKATRRTTRIEVNRGFTGL